MVDIELISKELKEINVETKRVDDEIDKYCDELGIKNLLNMKSIPELRFKDDNGNDFPDWDNTVLDDLGTTYSGLSGKTSKDFEG